MGATLSGPKEVTLTTDVLQTSASYSITVAGTLHDTYGKGCMPPNDTATFAGPQPCTPSRVVISQVYGGGGNGGAPLKNDFIELHNRATVPVSISGWSVQYQSQSGTTWNKTVIPDGGVIAAGGYFLVQEGSGGAVGSALPAPDATGAINMSGTDGKVALVNNATQLPSGCTLGAPIVDFIGFGSVTCAEGTAAPSPSNTTSVMRGATACTDSDMNGADFSAVAPTAHNSASAANSCGCN
jgi:predicted extracellular nuclease